MQFLFSNSIDIFGTQPNNIFQSFS